MLSTVMESKFAERRIQYMKVREEILGGEHLYAIMAILIAENIIHTLSLLASSIFSLCYVTFFVLNKWSSVDQLCRDTMLRLSLIFRKLPTSLLVGTN